MSDGRNGRESRRAGDENTDSGESGSRLVFGAFWALLLAGTVLVATPWAGFHAVLLGCVGVLMLVCPPEVALPRWWWLLAAVFVVAAAAAFLPAGWFSQPEWRQRLAALGVQTGPLVVIQWRQALEASGCLASMLVGGLWLAGHRASPAQVRRWAMAFTLGVAAYAILAKVMLNLPHGGHPGTDGHFGFFPNRNHSATYLAMGAICGLGSVFQALRDRRFVWMAVGLLASGVCLWAVAGWSMSRGGVLLVAVGCLAWLSMLGVRYLGRNGLWALGLIALAAVGLFLIANSGVKSRLSETVGKAELAVTPADPLLPGEGKKAMDGAHTLDFRIPTALDTFDLIRDFKWTGVGAGQYFYVFPQYRNLTAIDNDSDSFHPESDWLWLAAEAGVPAALALAALVLLAVWQARGAIVRGRDRALRSACLVAALLVPIHGLFDVPGHRITLAWSAAFLFALALHAPAERPRPAPPRAWPFRLVALTLLMLAGWLASAQWWGGPRPAVVAGPLACETAMTLYREDQTLQKQAHAAGEPQAPAAREDLLEQALAQLDEAARLVPLDRQVRHLQGFIGLHFEDLDATSSQAFAIARALDPTWVNAPMRQAAAWSRTDPLQVEVLWREALRRAEWMDLHHPGSAWSRGLILEAIRQAARGHPELEAIEKKFELRGVPP